MAALLAAGLAALPEFTYAASFNRNLANEAALPALAGAVFQPFGTPLIGGAPVVAVPALAPSSQRQAQARTKAPLPSPAVERAPSGADIVNKMLTPGPSNPNVPMPRADLAEDSAASQSSSNRPRIFGRGEEGGGVLGLRVPIPADRNLAKPNTTSGDGGTGAESLRETR